MWIPILQWMTLLLATLRWNLEEMLLGKSIIDTNVDKTVPTVGIETSVSAITVLCIIKEEFRHIWIELQSLSIWVRKKKTKWNIHLSPQLQEWGNISKPAKMADLCNCRQIFFNLPVTSCSIPTTLLHYIVNITIWLCCLFQEKSDPYVLLFCLCPCDISPFSHTLIFFFLFGFMEQHY